MNTITNSELSVLSNKEKCKVMRMIIKKQVEYAPSNPYPQCETCRYLPLNITQNPCIVCEHGSEFVRSKLSEKEGQVFD